jgi:hypothetical protein
VRDVDEYGGLTVGVSMAFGATWSSYFPGVALEYSCSAIHLTASSSVIKSLITAVSPSGHKISTPQPDPGFFRATKVGIRQTCACGLTIQASHPAIIKLTDYRTA